MRITPIDLDPRDVTEALAESHRLLGLPLSDRKVLLYAVGVDTDVRDYIAHAGAMARTLGEGTTIAMVCQSDFPDALEEFGLDHWDQIVYLADRRPVLSWPMGGSDEDLPVG